MQERMHDKASRSPVNLAEWAQDHQLPDTQGLPVPLGDRLRTLRKERGWNQDDLAQAIGAAGAHQISRYEAGKITPNTDTMIRIAETFNVSLDYLLIDDTPRRPLHAPTTGIDQRLDAIAQLSPEDTTALNNVIDAFTTRTRLRLITN
jgi:transcriptional regulator with XRE-family HTH domain